MKKVILAAALAAILSGCAGVAPEVKPSVIVEYKYVATPIPDALLSIPPRVSRLDISTATQKTVADWIIQNDMRMAELESKLKAVKDGQFEQHEYGGGQ